MSLAEQFGVKSVANQAATFPSSLKFKDSTCTNRKARIVMYMNYFKQGCSAVGSARALGA